MRFLPLFALAILALPAGLSSATAQECKDQTQMGLTQCADAAYRKTDATLNQVYGQVVARLKNDAATKAKLVTAQKAWIAFRDAECNFLASSVEQGSMYPEVVLLCVDGLAAKRVDDLRALLNCAEGDAACPVPPAP